MQVSLPDVELQEVGRDNPCSEFLVVHLALDKRTVDVDFVFDLSVSKVGVFLKEFELEMIAIRVTGWNAVSNSPRRLWQKQVCS